MRHWPRATRAGLSTGPVLLSLVVLTLGPAAPVLRAQHDATATLTHAVDAYAKVTTARGSFEQSLTNPLTGTTAVARGDFIQQRPSHLAVHFTAPSADDRIVADGKWVWVYVPSATPGQVMRMPVSDEAAGNGPVGVDFLTQFLAKPMMDRYAVSDAGADTVAGARTHAIVLIPRGAAQFTRAKLWVDDTDGVVRQFEVADASGTIRRVRVLKVTFNVPVDRAAFTFTPPAGVKVVDQSSMLNGKS
jgi:outer membrane lipoprotein carrier protein